MFATGPASACPEGFRAAAGMPPSFRQNSGRDDDAMGMVKTADFIAVVQRVLSKRLISSRSRNNLCQNG
jgi:hypothetical protein